MVDLANPGAMRDLTGREDWQEWSRHIVEEVVPNLERSKAQLILYSGTHEPKQAIEIGYGILLGKPIVVAHMPEVAVPWKLQKIANYVVEADMSTPESKAEFQRKLTRIVRGL